MDLRGVIEVKGVLAEPKFGVAEIEAARSFGFKVDDIGTRTRQDTGVDTDSLAIACSLQW